MALQVALNEYRGGRTKTDQPEPAGNGQEPKFTFPAINQIITFKDGNSIHVIVNSWEDRDMDEATEAYYNMLAPILDELEGSK